MHQRYLLAPGAADKGARSWRAGVSSDQLHATTFQPCSMWASICDSAVCTETLE